MSKNAPCVELKRDDNCSIFLGLTVECTSADSELGHGVTISFVLNDMTLYVLQNKS